MAGAINVPVVSTFDAKGINKAISQFKKLDGGIAKTAYAMKSADKAFTNAAKKLAKFGAIGIGVAGVVGKKLVDAGSDLAESQSKVQVVFGKSSKVVEDFAKNAADSMGMSRQKALEATGTYGNLFQAFGVGQTQAASMSTSLVQLAGDLASFNNASPEDVLLALRSGLSGEAEPLKRFGIAINDARLKQEALNMGLYNGKGILSVNAKTQAAYALIMKDSTLAQGDYARTADGVANTMRSLQANFADVSAELGQILIPYFQRLLSVVKDSILPRVREFVDILGQDGLRGALKYLGGEFLGFLGNMGKTGNIIFGVVTAFVALKAATIAFTATVNILTIATKLFGIQMETAAMGPFALWAAAIAVIITIIVALYMKFEWFRKAVNAVLNFIIGLAENWVNMWIKGINLIIMSINAMIRIANFFGSTYETLGHIGEVAFGRIGDAADTAKEKMKGAFQALGTLNEKYDNFGEKVVKTTEDQEDQEEVIKTGTKTVETAKQKLEKYISALKGLTSAQKNQRDANKAVTKANADALKAQENLTKATEHFNNVVNGYGKDSKQAKTAEQQRELAQRDLEKAGYDVESATYAVADAEAELALVRADPKSDLRDIREAEIALAEAKLSLRDNIDKQNASTEELTYSERLLDEAINGAKEGSDAYSEALDALTQAKQEQVDATDAVTEAYQRQRDAVYELKKAEEELEAARGKVTPKQIAVANEIVTGDKTGGSKLPYGSFMEAVQALHPGAKSLTSSTPVTASRKQFPNLYQQYKDAGLAMAKGGIVTGPTQILAGEAGAEAIIPLDKLQTGMNIYLTVHAGMGTNGKDVGDEIVDVLKRYNRRNGALPLAVA